MIVLSPEFEGFYDFEVEKGLSNHSLKIHGTKLNIPLEFIEHLPKLNVLAPKSEIIPWSLHYFD